MANHIATKTPIDSYFARCVRSLNPIYMVEDLDAPKKLFDRILAKLVSTKHFRSEFADECRQRCSAFLQIIVKADEASFLNFKINSTMLDACLVGYIKCSVRFNKLVNIVKFVLILSHSQSIVERDFSVNKNLLVENLQESSLTAQVQVLDHMSASCFETHASIIFRNLIRSVKRSRQRYDHKFAENCKQIAWKEKEEKANKANCCWSSFGSQTKNFPRDHHLKICMKKLTDLAMKLRGFKTIVSETDVK